MKTKTEKQASVGAIKILKYIKALLISLIVTFSLIIIFALVIKWTNLKDSVITPVNLVIKGISVFLGALILTKGSTKGLLHGILFGAVYTIIAFSVFSLLVGEFLLGVGFLSDIAFSAVVGAIAGIIGVNIKKK